MTASRVSGDAVPAPHVHSVLERHRVFAVLASAGFAVLYAELGLFMHLLWRARPDAEAAVVICLIFAVALAGYWSSFTFARTFTVTGVERQGSVVVPGLAAQTARGAGVVAAVTVVCFALSLYLVAFNPVPAYSLLNNLYVFALAGAGLLHGLVAYVRYGSLLYAVKQDSWPKILAVSGGIGVAILSAAQFLMKLNIDWLNAAPAAQQGLVGLHVYGRDLYFFTLVLAIYLWHARWMLDH